MRTNKKKKQVSSDACTLGTRSICRAARPHGEIQSRLSRGIKVSICMWHHRSFLETPSRFDRVPFKAPRDSRDSHLGVFAVHREGCVFNQW